MITIQILTSVAITDRGIIVMTGEMKIMTISRFIIAGIVDKTRDEVSSWFGDGDAARRRRMDEIRDHRGKGPKNYQRSSERIKEDVTIN